MHFTSCFTYSEHLLVEHLLKSKKEYKKSEKTGDSRYIYQNEFDKLCFQHNMAYGDFKDLAKKYV